MIEKEPEMDDDFSPEASIEDVTVDDGKKIKTIKSAVELAIIDARSQVLLERLAKRQKNLPKLITERYDDDKQGIEKCLSDSDKILATLIRDGTEIITNVRVANDKREVDRRIKEAELRDQLLEKLELESGEATAKFDAITSKWSQLEEMKDPMGIFEGLDRQKSRIADLMKQKDQIIGECRNELRAADERYTLSLDKQEIDVECLVDRIDNQIDIIKTAYREHLELLENTINDERHTLQLAFNKKWESLFEKRGINEDLKMRKEKEMSEFYANELSRIVMEHEEMTKSTRIRLDLDNQNLELELQKVKADVMLNSEKLDYNYNVLKRRENENVIIRNQQRRRLAKLHDTIAEMKNKMKQTKLNCKGETEKMTAEIMKLHSSIFDLEKKKDVLSEINDKKFQAVWQTNFDEAMSMLHKVLNIDKILHEQQLGLQWNEPDVKLLQRKDLPSYKSAMELMKSAAPAKVNFTEKESLFEDVKQERDKQFHEKKFLQHILYTIADKAEFLVENKLLELIEPYSEVQKALVRLDNVFSVLGIQNPNEIDMLQDYFLPYAECRVCNMAGDEKLSSSNESGSSENQSNCSENGSSSNSSKLSNHCEHGHDLLVEPNSVLKALRDFTKARLQDPKITRSYGESVESRLKTTKSTLSRMLSTDDVEVFWTRFKEVFSKQDEKLWNAMEGGLTQYLDVLKQREKLDNECEFLRKQNTELNHLLQKYVEHPSTPQNRQIQYFTKQ